MTERRPPPEPLSPQQRRGVLRGLLAFLLSVPVVWACVFFAWVGWMELTGYRDFEGAGTMGVAFFYAPVLALIGGFLAARCVRRRP